jgi:hypothetical protein
LLILEERKKERRALVLFEGLTQMKCLFLYSSCDHVHQT